MRNGAGPNEAKQSNNLIVLPGVTVRLPLGAADPELLMPQAYELLRLARDVRLAVAGIKEAQANGAAFRPDLVPWLEALAGQVSYRAGQIEADVLEGQGFGDVA